MSETQRSTQTFDDQEFDKKEDSTYWWAQLRSLNSRLQDCYITSPEIVVGRNKQCALVVSDPRISQWHFKIAGKLRTEASDDVTAILEDTRFFSLFFFPVLVT